MRHASNAAATSSSGVAPNASGTGESTSWAAVTRATHTDICVSSLHSPGA
ncbi:Uncharacterised protein [Mycobacteroides abscessus]|nr:Uncharacterised protein [Mycobacteroides abscessus]